MEKYLQNFSARTVLEIGPGYGEFGRVAARVTGATDVTLLDCDQKVLNWQADKYARTGLTICRSLCMPITVEALSKLHGPFDLILCQEILEHLPDAEEILMALTKQLESNGHIAITVPTKFSERWLKWLNPSYMRNEPYGHVRQFDENALRHILEISGLSPIVFIPTQPHYFVSHTWLFGTRMKVEGSTGKVLTKGIRNVIFQRLNAYSKRFFMLTGPEWSGRRLPRNYFVVATTHYQDDS